MVRIKSIRAFTLVETLVSGVLISVISGLSLMIYLNVTSSLAKTVDIMYQEIARNQADSLSLTSREYEVNYDFNSYLTINALKKIYDKGSNVHHMKIQLLDSANQLLFTVDRLIYDPN